MRAAPFDRMRAAAMLLEIDARAMRRARERVGDIAIGLPELGQQIARAGAMDARCARRERLPAVRHRRQRLVVDRDQRGGVLGDVARLRDHDRHRLADKGDLVLGQDERRDVGRKLRGAKLQRKPLLCEQRRKIGEREHGMHAGHVRAALTSMPRITACACGLRTNAASSMSAKCRSSTKRPAP